MKKTHEIKRYLLDRSIFRTILKAGLGISILSWVLRYLFFVNKSSPALVNYTSRVIHGGGLYLSPNSDSVRLSMLTSGGCYLNAKNGIYIGEGTIFSCNVVIVSEDHNVSDLDTSPDSEPIRIGKYCWIGANSSLLPGVVLGDRVIVGANSVVTRSFAQGNVVIAGTPARVLRHLDHGSNAG